MATSADPCRCWHMPVLAHADMLVLTYCNCRCPKSGKQRPRRGSRHHQSWRRRGPGVSRDPGGPRGPTCCGPSRHLRGVHPAHRVPHLQGGPRRQQLLLRVRPGLRGISIRLHDNGERGQGLCSCSWRSVSAAAQLTPAGEAGLAATACLSYCEQSRASCMLW